VVSGGVGLVGEGVIPKMGMMKEERKRRKRGQDLTSLRTKVVKEVSKVVSATIVKW
jgi:hypothetical protein